MKIIKAAFSKTFPITQYYEKIYLEAELNDGDDARQVLYDLKKQVNTFFYESNAAAEKQMGTQVKEVTTIEEDKDWEKVKLQLAGFKYKEDAEMFLAVTDYRMTIEAKQIINSKPSKNEKK